MLVHRAMAKYGIANFEFRIIQKLSTQEKSLAAEKYWIKYYQSNIYKYPRGLGYNLTDGGDTSTLGLKWSEESKRNFAGQRRGEKNGASILQNKDVVEIKQLLLEEVPIKDIATKYHTSYQCINDIRTGKRWSHIVVGNDLDIAKMGRKLSNLGKTFSIETKNKMSNSKKRENLSKITREKLSLSHRGDNHHQAKITEIQALEIKKMIASGMKPIKISRLLQISKHIIYDINIGKTWKHI
jgi:hypothetical protein